MHSYSMVIVKIQLMLHFALYFALLAFMKTQLYTSLTLGLCGTNISFSFSLHLVLSTHLSHLLWKDTTGTNICMDMCTHKSMHVPCCIHAFFAIPLVSLSGSLSWTSADGIGFWIQGPWCNITPENISRLLLFVCLSVCLSVWVDTCECSQHHEPEGRWVTHLSNTAFLHKKNNPSFFFNTTSPHT